MFFQNILAWPGTSFAGSFWPGAAIRKFYINPRFQGSYFFNLKLWLRSSWTFAHISNIWTFNDWLLHRLDVWALSQPLNLWVFGSLKCLKSLNLWNVWKFNRFPGFKGRWYWLAHLAWLGRLGKGGLAGLAGWLGGWTGEGDVSNIQTFKHSL